MLVIGIAGGSGSGKSTVVRKIIDLLPEDTVTILPQDAYYYDNGHLTQEEKRMINFDHPDSIEFSLLGEHISLLKKGDSVGMPIYSYVSCARDKETIALHPRKVLIVEGILILTNKEIRDKLDIKVFVDADADDRLIRIIRRDIIERGRSYQDVLRHYELFVKPMHLQFIEPTKRYADIIVPQGGTNTVAIEIMASRIQRNLTQS